MLAESIRDIIINNAAAVAGLATWEFSTGAPEPAVFTDRRTPAEAGRPAVEIMESGGTNEGVRGFAGRDAILSIRVMGDKAMSQQALRTAAEAVHDAVDRQTTNFDLYTRPRGYEGIATLADSPQGIEDEDGFPGYLIVCRALVMKL